MEEILLRPEKAAELLGIARSTVYTMVASGELPSVRFGRSIRLPVAALRRWVAERTEQVAVGAEQ